MTGTCQGPHSQGRLQPSSLMLALLNELAMARFSAGYVLRYRSASPQCSLAEKSSHLDWLSGDI